MTCHGRICLLSTALRSKAAKVMFSQASVILSTIGGSGYRHTLDKLPSWTPRPTHIPLDTPPGHSNPLPLDTPTPWTHQLPGHTHPPLDTPWTPPWIHHPQTHHPLPWTPHPPGHPPGRKTRNMVNEQSVRILLECNLVK